MTYCSAFISQITIKEGKEVNRLHTPLHKQVFKGLSENKA